MAIERNTGYRDPHKALTLKALQERQKAAAAAFAGSGGMDQISTPFAGAANMLDELGANRAQRHADEAEGSARAQLAQIMSGVKPQGATTEQLAQIGTYDPELAKALREELERKLTLEDTQQQQTSERLGSQDFTAGESQLTREQQTKLQEDTQAEARTTAETLAKTQAEKARLDASLSSDEAKVRAELAAGTIDQTEADRRLQEISRQKEATYQSTKPDIYGGMVRADQLNPELKGTPEGEVLVQENLDSSKVEPVLGTPSTKINVGGEQTKLDEQMDVEEAKNWNAFQQARDVAGQQMGDIKLLGELTKIAPQGPIIGNLAQLPVLRNFSSAGAAFQSIVNRVAPTLRVAGSGSTSDLEYTGMLRSLTNLGNYPEANNLILGMMQAKAQINMDRGNAIDAYRNGQLTQPQLRAKLQEINQRSIMTPELQVLLDKVGPDELSDVEAEQGSSDVDDLIRQANEP